MIRIGAVAKVTRARLRSKHSSLISLAYSIMTICSEEGSICPAHTGTLCTVSKGRSAINWALKKVCDCRIYVNRCGKGEWACSSSDGVREERTTMGSASSFLFILFSLPYNVRTYTPLASICKIAEYGRKTQAVCMPIW